MIISNKAIKQPPITEANISVLESILTLPLVSQVSVIGSVSGLTHKGSTRDDMDKLHDKSTLILATPDTKFRSDFKDCSKCVTTLEASISVVGRTLKRYISVLDASALQYSDPFTRLSCGNEQSQVSLILSDSFSFRKVFTSVLSRTYMYIWMTININLPIVVWYCLHTLPLSQPWNGPALIWTNTV